MHDSLDEKNKNKELRIQLLKQLPREKLRKRRAGAHLVPPLTKRIRRNHDNHLLNLGNLEPLGADNLLEIFSRVDVLTLLRCFLVNKTLFTLITSPGFRRSWRGNNAVILGSRALPWRLVTPGGPNNLFPPLNSPSSSIAGEVLASSAGLLCINIHSTNAIMELAVGNPLTQEWVLLPVPDREFPRTSRMSYRMEASEDGHFKVAACERGMWFYRVFIYDSASDSWGVTELHYVPFCGNKWSDYDLTAGGWRSWLTIRDERGYIKTCDTSYDYELSHPFHHGFCVWEHKSTTYFASPWTDPCNGPMVGYGVWELESSTGLLSMVSVMAGMNLSRYGWSTALNNREGVYISCNAFENVVCFMGESPVHPAMPVVYFNVDSKAWVALEADHPDHAPKRPPVLGVDELVKAYDHYSVAVVYSPSLLAPAQSHERSKRRSAQGSRQGYQVSEHHRHQRGRSAASKREEYHSRAHRHARRKEKEHHSCSRRPHRHRHRHHHTEHRYQRNHKHSLDVRDEQHRRRYTGRCDHNSSSSRQECFNDEQLSHTRRAKHLDQVRESEDQGASKSRHENNPRMKLETQNKEDPRASKSRHEKNSAKRSRSEI